MKNRLFVQFISFTVLISLVFLGMQSYVELNKNVDHIELTDQQAEEEENLKKSVEDDFFHLTDMNINMPIQAFNVLFPNHTMRLPFISHFRHYPPPNTLS